MKFKKYAGNPILGPNEANAWEASVATNPAAWYDEEKDEFLLIYRAAGHDEKHIVVLAMAKSKDGFHFERCSDEPLFAPEATGPDAGLHGRSANCENGRVLPDHLCLPHESSGALLEA